MSENRVISLTEDIQNNVAEYTQIETVMIPEYRRLIEELKLERNKTINLLANTKKKNIKNFKPNTAMKCTTNRSLRSHPVDRLRTYKFDSE